MIENQPLPLEGIDENRWAVNLADFEIVRLIAEKLGLEYDEGWSYKVIHAKNEDESTLVMARKDIPEQEKPSPLVLP